MQTPSSELIELLAEKKLNGTISAEENVILERWLKQRIEGEGPLTEFDNDPLIRKRLLDRIRQDAGMSDASLLRTKKRGWRGYHWIAAASILFFIISGISYLLFWSGNHLPVLSKNGNVVTGEQDVAPGHSGAVLTLANGQKIVLDSAGNGEIAEQKDHKLIKRNGQLVYEKTIREKPEREGAEKTVSYNTLATPRGREFRIILSDGSKVWLNAASSITYPTDFKGEERKVTITGEAYFEITEDSRRPFIVSVGDAEVRVLGTHFDIMAYPDEHKIKTTLLEGSVRIDRGEWKVVIRPGQQALFSASSDHIKIEKVNADQVVAWTAGKLSLDNLGVKAIMRKISRWYDIDVEFEGPVSQDRFWGIINRQVSLLDMLKVMRINGINAKLINNKIVVQDMAPTGSIPRQASGH